LDEPTTAHVGAGRTADDDRSSLLARSLAHNADTADYHREEFFSGSAEWRTSGSDD